ncbi:hypothetical protein OLMES_3492 [Oleiphilus messinensis]|uniref:Uncharacterized protein n=2 Tax=Oleiphilus messinensis TaxID=141451 RepID=A0A1Y0IAI0_9GAMM|nr:hypothetical protein OLMES_3492 [Oleiphilus messinensis]
MAMAAFEQGTDLTKTRQCSFGKQCLSIVSGGLLLIGSTLYPADSYGELKAISDEEMSDITGQAFISIDQNSHPTQSDISYTRVNLGMKIDTMMVAEEMELGKYHRWENHPTDPSLNGKACYTCDGSEAGLESTGADIHATNFSLGYIHSNDYTNKYKSVPMVAKGFDSRGRPINYSEGEVVPFQINDPFLEFAFDDATNEMIGVRIGFGDSKGILSGNILSLSGAVEVDIRDDVDGLSAARQKQDGNILEEALTLLTPLLVADGELSAQAILVDENGEADPVRSQYIGMQNGTEFTIEGADFLAAGVVPLLSDANLIGSASRSEQVSSSGCGLFGLFACYNIYIQSDDCVMLGIPTCFPLTNFQSMPVGKVEEINGRQYITDTASGLFLSFQTRDMEWSTDSSATAMSNFVSATSGAFLNLPTGAVKVNLHEVYEGIHGVRREYIDRGVGLF